MPESVIMEPQALFRWPFRAHLGSAGRLATIGSTLLALGLVAGSCAGARTGPAGAQAPLADVVRREVASLGALIWSPSRPLTWSDFRGSAPAVESDDGARTAYSLFHGVRCTGARFEFRVIVAMLPDQSWVSPAVRADERVSAQTLRHEQTHFNLSEVHARRMRRYFAELYAPCDRSEQELAELANGFIRDEAQAQLRYEQETRNGRLPQAQSGWDGEVTRLLGSLGRWGAQ